MGKILKIEVCSGVTWIEIPEAGLYLLCGSPPNVVKHLIKKELIHEKIKDGVSYESGPNAILLSDLLIQNESFSNMAEFPVLQMLYRQGMVLPNHPGNTGTKPILIGSEEQVHSQLQYIYRGNYGLISKEEIIACGIDSEMSDELMQMKLKFAFGKIQHPNELIDSRIVKNDQVEIFNGVKIERKKTNIFRIRYQEEEIDVDLSLAASEKYSAPYSLNFHDIKKESFSIIHSGESDGWDINRPCVASVIMLEGKIFLVDVGPDIGYSLTALGIGISEIEGIFQTHCHDDHICGLATLMRSDRKMTFYSTKLVWSSVVKKLSELLGLEEIEFESFFNFIPLDFDVWNRVVEMEVRPLHSPHPVETNIFIFRVKGEDDCKSYGHFADVVSINVLEKMVRGSKLKAGISKEFLERVKKDYLEEVDIKKIDIGGGLIHGQAQDFVDDKSKKIVLAHLPFEQVGPYLEMGTYKSFGEADVLIPAKNDFLLEDAKNFFKDYFSSISEKDLDCLFENPIITYGADEIILNEEDKSDFIYLVLTGIVEKSSKRKEGTNYLYKGSLIGENAVVFGLCPFGTFRALSFAEIMRIPKEMYLKFVQLHQYLDKIKHFHEKWDNLTDTWLFGDSIAYPVDKKIVDALEVKEFKKYEVIPTQEGAYLNVIISGEVDSLIGGDILEIIKKNEFFSEETFLYNVPAIYTFQAVEDTVIYRIPGQVLLDIPIVHLKLLEVYDKRMSHLHNVSDLHQITSLWKEEYSVNVQRMDKHHKLLFGFSYKLIDSMQNKRDMKLIKQTVEFLSNYTVYHFAEEEKLLRQYGYPRYNSQIEMHKKLCDSVEQIRKEIDRGNYSISSEIIDFLKSWIINHILYEDRKYTKFLNEKGVF